MVCNSKANSAENLSQVPFVKYSLHNTCCAMGLIPLRTMIIRITTIYRVQASYQKLGDVLFRFFVSGRSFKLGFTLVYMFYKFKPLPQLKIWRNLSF